jgi:glyoxylase-like metal-dependent hydrolase (beta-lactamase superfamily II)
MKIHTLDLKFQNTPNTIASYLVESDSGLALIETGPGSTLPQLRHEIATLGFREEDIKHVFVTHIHLDHAGAAGWWAQQGAQVFCHPSAARHLVEPSRLIESARRVYLDQMDHLWGEMLPAPEARVTALGDGESVSLGSIKVTAWDTPGHARHHHAFIIGEACFTGDVAGARLQASPYLSVTSAPPQFEPPAYLNSLDRLIQAGFQRLYLTHFGEVTDAQFHLTNYRQRIQDVYQKVRDWVAEGANAEEIQKRYHDSERAIATAAGVSEEQWQLFQMANGTKMSADGIRLYVEKSSKT